MSQPELIANQVTSKSEDELEGLSDGGHNFIACSNCKAALMDIWVTRPHETEAYKIRATCPWCNDKSFITRIVGGFHYGGCGSQNGGDVEDTIESTSVDHFEIKNGVFEFTVLKASHDAVPIIK